MPTPSTILDSNAFVAGDDGEPPVVTRRRRLLGSAYRLFYRDPVELVRGEGCRLWDADGREYLDVYNNVACVGHCHPRVVEAITRQAATLNTHTRYLSTALLDYAEDLLCTMPTALDRVMFACTGSEANDLALRIAREATGGRGIIVTAQAYHGNTDLVSRVSPSLGSGAPTSREVWLVPAPDSYRVDQDGVGPAFDRAVAGALDGMAAAGVRPAALLVDTIFSSDGIFADPAGFLAPAVERVRRAGGVLIADEVQPGFARTGTAFWGFERHGLVPEIVTMGKPMGNGYPVSAVAAQEAVLEPFATSVPYFNTFGGANVAIAAAQAVLNVIRDEGLQERAAEVGRHLRAGLRELADAHQGIGDVRGDGLYTGLELVADRESGTPDGALAAAVVNGLRGRGVLTSVCGPAGAVLKLRPPLVFQVADADRLIDALDAELAALDR